jgi:hypothetical protein
MRRTALILVLAWTATVAAAPKKKHGSSRHSTPATSAPAPTPAPEPTAAPVESAAPATSAPAAESAPAAAAPAPAPPPPPAPAAPPPREEAPPPARGSVDLEALANEYNQLRDELFRSRAKARLLGDAMFKTRINATFKYKAQRAWPVKKVTLRIDDQPVFTADAPAVNDPLKLYDGFAAPGKHTLALRVECGAVGEDRVAYSTEGVFAIDVPERKETRVALVVDEVGDGPQKLANKREGTFDVRVRAEVEPVEIVK